MSPHTEPDSDTWIKACTLSAIIYGAASTLFYMTVYSLLIGWTSNITLRRQYALLLAYVLIVYGLGTTAILSELIVYPLKEEWIPRSVPLVVTDWLAMGFLIWRCSIMYRNASVSLWTILIIPCLLWAASLATGIIHIVKICSPSLIRTSHFNPALVYAALSFSGNLLLSFLIFIRLLKFRWNISMAAVNLQMLKYTTILGILIESAALMDIFHLLYFVLLALDWHLHVIAQLCLIQAQVIAPLTIIFRLVQQKASSSENFTHLITQRTNDAEYAANVSKMSFSSNATVAYSTPSSASKKATKSMRGLPTVNESAEELNPDLFEDVRGYIRTFAVE